MKDTMQSPTQSRTSPLTKLVDLIARVRRRPRTHPQGTAISHSEALDILASDRRRYIIEYLADRQPGETVTTSDLAESVAAREHECGVGEVTSDQRSRVYIAGHQQHLPKLDRLGYVEYAPDRGTVRSTSKMFRVWDAYREFRSELTG